MDARTHEGAIWSQQKIQRPVPYSRQGRKEEQHFTKAVKTQSSNDKRQTKEKGLASRDKRRPPRPATSTSPLLVLAAVAGVPSSHLRRLSPRPRNLFSQNRFRPGALLQRAASCRRWIRFTSVSLLGGFCFFLLFPREGQQQTKRAKRAGTARSGDFKGRGRVLGRRRDTSSLSSCPLSRGFSLVLAPRGQNSSG